MLLQIGVNQQKLGALYTKDCETKRTNQICTAVDYAPTICIGFNPDSYINKKDEIIEGCFTSTPQICVVRCDEDELCDRLQISWD